MKSDLSLVALREVNRLLESKMNEGDESGVDSLTKRQIIQQLSVLETMLKKVRDDGQRKLLLQLVKELSLELTKKTGLSESDVGENAMATVRKAREKVDSWDSGALWLDEVKEAAKIAAKDGLITAAQARDVEVAADDVSDAAEKWNSSVRRLYAQMQAGSRK